MTDPFTIGAVAIAPGESIIFAESLSASQFAAWWGSNNLPATLKVVTYSGSGFTLGTSGDGLRLWDNLTTNVNETVARVDFGAATASVSFSFNPVTQQFGVLSQVGVNGAFKATAATDIGSPGRVRSPVVAPLLAGVLSNSVFRVEFATIPAAHYSLELREDFAESTWTPTGDTLIATNAAIGSFTKPLETANRFYRVVAE